MLGLYFRQLDEARRLQGRAFDMIGFAPIETPSRVVYSLPAATLLSYGPPRTGGPVLLIVPAPIKRAYIWDLAPGASTVQICLRNGIQVYLIRWEQAPPGERDLGLAHYAERVILASLAAVEAEVGLRRVFLAGHSLGGTFAAIFSSLHPERVQGVILLGAPLHFGRDIGHFGPWVAVSPRAGFITDLLGDVPGSFLSAAGVLASPASFVTSRWQDRLKSLSDATALRTHLRVERWTLDEMELPRKLFEEVMEWLYRENRFMRGTLAFNGKRASPGRVNAPVLSVVDPKSLIVPPESVLPFHRAISNVEQKLIPYPGDVGVALQHVGMLIGRKAHRILWPQILKWLFAQERFHGSLR